MTPLLSRKDYEVDSFMFLCDQQHFQESPATSRKVLIENNLEEMSCKAGSPDRDPRPESAGEVPGDWSVLSVVVVPDCDSGPGICAHLLTAISLLIIALLLPLSLFMVIKVVQVRTS